MTTIRLPENIDTRLNKLVKLTHRSKSFYIREAIERYLEEMEDGYLALERIANPNRQLLTTEEVLKQLDEDESV